jgi:hypothetical protein
MQPSPAPPLGGPGAPQRFPAPPAQPVPPLPGRSDADDHRQARVPMLALVLVAAMALLGGGIAAYLVLHGPGGRGPTPGPSASPTAETLEPPRDLKLRDEGTSITLTWTDPSGGTVPFIVAGGRSAAAAKSIGTVESGKTTFRLDGLSPTADFCFLVAAVYSGNNTVLSAPACTTRNTTTPTPKR